MSFYGEWFVKSFKIFKNFLSFIVKVFMNWCKRMMKRRRSIGLSDFCISNRLSKFEEGLYGVNWPKQLIFVSNYRIVGI